MTRPAALACLCAAALLSGCGGGETTEPGGQRELSLLLDYFPNADHAGIYAAEAGGHFDQEGLDVTVRAPSDPAAPIKQVAAGQTDLAISYEPEVLRARDQGLPVVSVAALVQEPLTSLISLPEGEVDEPADLAGKTVGTAGIDYQSAFLEAILDEAGVDPASVKERNLGFNLSQGLLTGKADAVLGAFWNYEGTELRLQGKDPQIIKMEDAGIPTYDELVVVANEERIAEDPRPIRAFLRALSKGTDDLQAAPDAAVDALLEENPELDQELQREVVQVTLPHFLPPDGRPYGWHDQEAWTRFGDFMHRAGLLEGPPDGGGSTNKLLPKT
jgi:putative hydroxymethylpyrimidine transport system substrate-binding protein